MLLFFTQSIRPESPSLPSSASGAGSSAALRPGSGAAAFRNELHGSAGSGLSGSPDLPGGLGHPHARQPEKDEIKGVSFKGTSYHQKHTA